MPIWFELCLPTAALAFVEVRAQTPAFQVRDAHSWDASLTHENVHELLTELVDAGLLWLRATVDVAFSIVPQFVRHSPVPRMLVPKE
jgi:hypothetical protein